MASFNLCGSTIIILNGPSSSGKTSIQKAIQELASEEYLRIGIDGFFDALIETPDLSRFQVEKKFDQYTHDGQYIRGIELTHDKDGNPIVPLKIGPAGDRIIFGMHRAIRGYAEAGNNIVVDYILYKPEWAPDLRDVLKDQNVFYVKVTAPLDVIEMREKIRNTSPVGHARSHYDTVHQGMLYDLEIDTSKLKPEESAQIILEYIKGKNSDLKVE